MKHFYTHGRLFACFIILLSAASAAVMLLWNALVPGIFGLPTVTYLQALGLLVLTRLLVGGIHHGHPRGREILRDRWRGMSEEERRDLICRHMHHPGNTPADAPGDHD
ncbi:MAG: hypothetical protein LBI96_02535 [Odoribacteraceae bacterium]|jgi:hypothetical protein|nr:hypothetical protein [Odoribacteraceae bacterium]